MTQVVAGLYHEYCQALTVQPQVVDTGRQQGAPAAISTVHPGAVVHKQRRYLTAAVNSHVQLQCSDARRVDVVDAGAVRDEQ